MHRSRRFTLPALGLTLIWALLCQAGNKEFTPPEALHADQYPAHQAEPQQHTIVAADPYDTPEKQAIFRNDYAGHGFLPVRLIISNDGDLPLALTAMTVELDLGYHSRVQPATADELLRRMGEPPRHVGKREIPLPIPLPQPKPSNKKAVQVAEEYEQAQFAALAVEPHSTRSGFLFFDIAGIDAQLSGARVIVSKIRDGNGNELFYFEIPLRAAVGAATPAAP